MFSWMFAHPILIICFKYKCTRWHGAYRKPLPRSQEQCLAPRNLYAAAQYARNRYDSPRWMCIDWLSWRHNFVNNNKDNIHDGWFGEIPVSVWGRERKSISKATKDYLSHNWDFWIMGWKIRRCQLIYQGIVLHFIIILLFWYLEPLITWMQLSKLKEPRNL